MYFVERLPRACLQGWRRSRQSGDWPSCLRCSTPVAGQPLHHTGLPVRSRPTGCYFPGHTWQTPSAAWQTPVPRLPLAAGSLLFLHMERLYQDLHWSLVRLQNAQHVAFL